MRTPSRLILMALATIVPAAIGAVPQSAPTASDLNRDLAAAERLLQQQKAAEAKAAFEAILEPSRRLGLEIEEAQAHCGIGEALSLQTQYGQAEHALRRCLALYEQRQVHNGIGRATAALSIATELSGRYNEAAVLADRAIAEYTAAHNVRGRAIATLLRLRVPDGTLTNPESLYQRALDDARTAGDRRIEGGALHSWGDYLFGQDRFEEALGKLDEAREVFHALGRRDAEGTVYNSIGRVYRAHGRLDQALKFQLQALEIHRGTGAPFELLQSTDAVGQVYLMMGNPSQARAYFERALVLAERSSSPRIQDFLRANIANVLLNEGQYAQGARAIEEVVAHGLDAFPVERESQLSFAYLKLKRPEDALAAADKAFDMCGGEQSQCIQALDRRAAAHAALRDNDAALADVRAALDIVEGVRAKLVPSDFFKQNFHQHQQSVYSRAIAIGFDQGQDRESLETAEMARSRAFLDLLAAHDVRVETGGATAALTFRGAASKASADLRSPAIAAPAKTEDLNAIAARLRSTMVTYWVADDGIFIWVIKRDGSVASKRVDISKARLVQLIAETTPFQAPTEEPGRQARLVGTRGAAQIGVGGASPQSWRALYDLLIAPVREELPRDPGSLLTIVPHGPLLGLSFAALRDRRGRYLLEDYTIHYAPAGAVFNFTRANRHPDARGGAVLLVADPVLAPGSPLDPTLPPLPGARSEAASIARLVARDRVTLLEGRSATEPVVRRAAVGKSVVHFATHAIVRDEDPNGSYLALGPDAADPHSKGWLTAQDVYGLRLGADLVVLSACRSGGGPVTGDGIATFARAFMYAGAPSLVVSLWDVADEPTSRLLPAFYRRWFGGAPKANSLRRAQLQLLADLRAGAVRVETKAGPITLPEDPIFWAGFVLIGEPE
jgi:CHAT domain-containing protein/tetratricopeptide (TPR) repeat protein